jgi:hypothetical protein
LWDQGKQFPDRSTNMNRGFLGLLGLFHLVAVETMLCKSIGNNAVLLLVLLNLLQLRYLDEAVLVRSVFQSDASFLDNSGAEMIPNARDVM